MSAFDDGVEAGREFRSTGGSLCDYDAAIVREQATRDVGMCPWLPLSTRKEMVEDWLYGFWKGMGEEADDEA